MNTPIVVDSSVVVKWFVHDEFKTSPALKLLNIFKEGKRDFVIPDLLFYEVGNVFLKKWPHSLEKIEKAFVHLWHLPWFLIPLRQSLLTRTLEMAAHYGITFYDALFVATAEWAEAAFVTADKKMLSKIKHLPFVQSLEGFE